MFIFFFNHDIARLQVMMDNIALWNPIGRVEISSLQDLAYFNNSSPLCIP